MISDNRNTWKNLRPDAVYAGLAEAIGRTYQRALEIRKTTENDLVVAAINAGIRGDSPDDTEALSDDIERGRNYSDLGDLEKAALTLAFQMQTENADAYAIGSVLRHLEKLNEQYLRINRILADRPGYPVYQMLEAQRMAREDFARGYNAMIAR